MQELTGIFVFTRSLKPVLANRSVTIIYFRNTMTKSAGCTFLTFTLKVERAELSTAARWDKGYGLLRQS